MFTFFWLSFLLPESGWEYHNDHTHQSELEVPSSSHFTELHPATYYYGDVEPYHPPLDSGLGAFVPVVTPQVSSWTVTNETVVPYVMYVCIHNRSDEISENSQSMSVSV